MELSHGLLFRGPIKRNHIFDSVRVLDCHGLSKLGSRRMAENIELPDAAFISPPDDISSQSVIRPFVVPIRELSISEVNQVAVSPLQQFVVAEQRLETSFAIEEPVNHNERLPLLVIVLGQKNVVHPNILVSCLEFLLEGNWLYLFITIYIALKLLSVILLLLRRGLVNFWGGFAW